MMAEQAAEDVPRVPAWAAPPRSRIGRGWAVLALSVAYIALYVTLDRLSFIEAQHGINPPVSLLVNSVCGSRTLRANISAFSRSTSIERINSSGDLRPSPPARHGATAREPVRSKGFRADTREFNSARALFSDKVLDGFHVVDRN